MYCPKCGQEIVSDDLRFCSRCGFATNAVSELIKTDGVLTDGTAAMLRGERTPRQKGARQGMMLIFVGVVIVFMLAMLQNIIGLPETYGEAAAGIFLFAGVMRLIYAFGFEEGATSKADVRPPMPQIHTPEQLRSNANDRALPPEQSVPTSEFVQQRDTAEMAKSSSVTESTTRLLDSRDKEST